MSNEMLDEYEEYLVDFEAWGHEYFPKSLTYDAFEDLKLELEDIDISEECGHLSKKQAKRREQVQRLLLTHENYFADGPRVVITQAKEAKGGPRPP
jgi:hypothetical protein